jgi:hypothetical protein
MRKAALLGHFSTFWAVFSNQKGSFPCTLVIPQLGNTETKKS